MFKTIVEQKRRKSSAQVLSVWKPFAGSIKLPCVAGATPTEVE
jgi:hypothetical protein